MAYRGILVRLRVLKESVECLKKDVSIARSLSNAQNTSHFLQHHNKFALAATQCTRPFSISVCNSPKFRSPFELSHNGIDKVTVSSNQQIFKRYASSGDSSSSEKVKPRTEVSYEELVELIQKGDILLFDVREPKEIEQTGLMPGAVNIPITKLKTSLAMEEQEFSVAYGCSKPMGSGDNVLFCGFSNVKSEAALELAHKAGFKKARHYPGGWKEWAEKQSTG